MMYPAIQFSLAVASSSSSLDSIQQIEGQDPDFDGDFLLLAVALNADGELTRRLGLPDNPDNRAEICCLSAGDLKKDIVLLQARFLRRTAVEHFFNLNLFLVLNIADGDAHITTRTIRAIFFAHLFPLEDQQPPIRLTL